MQKGQGCQVQTHSRRVQDPQTGSLLPKNQETPQQVEVQLQDCLRHGLGLIFNKNILFNYFFDTYIIR